MGNSDSGCSGQIFVLILILIMVVGVGNYFRRLLVVPEEAAESAPSTVEDAQRCREKLISFKNTDYIKEITLTEMEVNSAIQEDLKRGMGSIVNMKVKFEGNKFGLMGFLPLTELFSSDNEEIPSIENIQPGDETLPEKRFASLQVYMSVKGTLSVADGQMRISPEKIVLGKFNLPKFLVRLLGEKKQSLFTINVLPSIKRLRLENKAIVLMKE